MLNHMKRRKTEMKIVIEGKEELLKKLERIQELSRELYREVSGVPLISVNYTPDEEKAACNEDTDGK